MCLPVPRTTTSYSGAISSIVEGSERRCRGSTKSHRIKENLQYSVRELDVVLSLLEVVRMIGLAKRRSQQNGATFMRPMIFQKDHERENRS